MDSYFESKPQEWIHAYIVTVAQQLYFHPSSFIEPPKSLPDLVERLNKPFLKRRLPYMNVIVRSVYFLQLIYLLVNNAYEGPILSNDNSSNFARKALTMGNDISAEIRTLQLWNNCTDTQVLSAYVSILLKVYRIEAQDRKAFKIELYPNFLYKDFPSTISES